MTRLFLAVVGVALVAGCTKNAPPEQTAKVVEQPQGPVIVRLVGQHQSITVTSGPDGPLYSAYTTDGQLIVANATLDDLRLEHPEVYQFIQPGIAVDASLETRAVPGTSPQRVKSGSSSDVLMLDSTR